jgi:ABC-type glycerol-3-phosphate transport system substrate-binding protein
MQFTKQQKIILGVVGFIILFFLLVLVGIIPGLRKSGPPTNISVWGIGDSSDVWAAAIKSYEASNPNVTVTYTEVDQSNYESTLINALAAGAGPDIFAFNNSWLPKNGDKIVPAPPSLMSTSTFANIFPQVASQDFVSSSSIYAMPLSIDTLALIYNRSIFNQSGVAIPPATWKQFDTVVLKTRRKTYGAITGPAVAMGGTLASMANATDIMNLLFLQEGTQMVNGYGGEGTFSSGAGQAALALYTQFATPSSAYYTWRDSLGPALTSFASGRSAMFIGYASQIPQIEAANPDISLGVSTMPQLSLSNQINYPNYWGLAVSKQSKDQTDAWNFIDFVTTDPTTANNYAIASGRPPALRSLIAQHEGDPVLGPYALQALTAEDWAQPDSDAVSTIFNNMIESVLNGSAPIDQALQTAELSVNSLTNPQ